MNAFYRMFLEWRIRRLDARIKRLESEVLLDAAPWTTGALRVDLAEAQLKRDRLARELGALT